MTAISLLGGDFDLLLDDENNQNGGSNAVAGMRAIVRPNSPATTNFYTTNQLYSAIADVTDDVVAMGFRNPMLPVTPNAYTIENKYYIQRRATEFLKEGAITNDHTVASGDGVLRKVYTVTTDFVVGDIGMQVLETTSGDAGTLLDFETQFDSTGTEVHVAYIRPDTSGDTFALSTVISVTGDGGTGTNTGVGAATSGVTKYGAIQAIGSVPNATEVYVYQDRNKLVDIDGNFQWWATDPTVSLGIVSILVKTQDSDTVIADGDVEVFARRYTSLYDNFRLNVAAGGFQALPLASAPDINNTTGDRRTTLSGAANTWEVGSGIYQGGTWATATAKGVITVGGSGATPTLEYYIVGDLTDLADATAVKEYVFSTQADGDGTGTAATPTENTGGPTETGAGNGATVTINITSGGYQVDHDGDATDEQYSVEVDAQGDVPIATVYEVIKYRTRRGSDEAGLFGAGTNIPGESYRGLEGIFEYDASTGTLGSGEDLLTLTGGSTWTGRLLSQNTQLATDYITVTDQQTSLEALANDDVVEDETGTEDVTLHEGGTLGFESIASVKASPLGTFTGSQIFGARGVIYVNPHSSDTQAYIVTDDIGTQNSPPNTISFAVDKTIADDWVTAAQMSATTGVMEKDVSGIWGLVTPAASYNRLGDLEVRVDGATTVSEDIPASGTLRIIDTAQKEEHLYHYSSRTLGTPGIFALTNEADFTGTADGGTSDTALVDAAATWTTGTVPLPGMMVRNVTNGGDVYEITEVTDANNLVLKKLYGSGDTFASGDTFEINYLIGGDHTATPADYSVDDGIYITYLDVLATGTSVSNQFIKSTSNDFTMVVNVRQGKVILPFTINQLQQDDAVTVTTVRTPDSIAV